MSKFEEHMKFANDVLRVRNAMINLELCERHRVFWDLRERWSLKTFKIHGRGSSIPMHFGDLSTFQYKKEDAGFNTVITSKSIVYLHDDEPALMTVGKEQTVDIVEYDEALHFQHSLLYSETQLRYLVVASVLRANPPANNPIRFKIFWHYVPILIKLLRYSDNGII